MGYSSGPIQEGCYENSTVLINKFDIRDMQELEIFERNPFREGNGRIQRLFLSMLLSNLGKRIDFKEHIK